MFLPRPVRLSPGPRIRRTARGQQGAAAVEMAIVLPLLLLLLFGLVDFGRMIQQQIQLTQAVREGARLGALNGTVADVQAQVAGGVGGGVALTFAGTAVCSAGSTVGADATVTARRTFHPATPVFSIMAMFGPAGGPVTLSATGVMGCLG